MTVTADEIVQKLNERRVDQADALARMISIRDAYHGDIAVPLPEIEEAELPAVANLLNQGLEQLSLRVASVMPDVVCPPRDKANKTEERHARDRRLAIFGWWEHSRMDMKLGQRARHLFGYSQSYAWVRWCPIDKIPKWRICDPLSTFPSESFLADHVNTQPADCIAVYTRRMKDLVAMYPAAGAMQRAAKLEDDQLIEVVEYVDGDEYVLVATGSHRDKPRMALTGGLAYTTADFAGGGVMVQELDRYPNRIEMIPVGAAVRQGLDRPMSKFEGMLGMYQMQSRLMALEILAVEKGIFADTWAVSRPGETVRIITPADGLRGVVGEIQGGELREMQTNPGFMTNPTIDRLERNQRVTAGIPSDFGGESASNIRTGRRGDAVLSATVDFPIQEAQRMLSRSLQHENKVGIALTKTYGGSAPKSFYVTWKGAKGWTDYTPAIFTTDENIVSYSNPGADLNDLVVGGGQRVGMKTMSRHRFMEIDPIIEDPEAERDLVTAEALEDALLSGIQNQAASGQIPPADIARIMRIVVTDQKSLAEAVEVVQREAQERQATPAPEGAPETMPGLAVPGMGAEQPVAAQEPPGGLAGLRSLLGSLNPAAGAPA